MEFKVNVRAGGNTGGAAVTDQLSLLHEDARTDPLRVALQMTVARGVAVAVIDINSVAIAGERAVRGLNDAVRDRVHRGAPGSCKVNAFVSPDPSGHRIAAASRERG